MLNTQNISKIGDLVSTGVPPTGIISSGDMYKVVYDQNNNGIVDDSEKLNGHDYTFFAESGMVGLVQGTESGNIGYWLAGMDRTLKGPIGLSAIDMSYTDYTDMAGYGATGYSSIATGTNTIASNIGSYAEGNNTQSLGRGSHTEGDSTIASGDFAHAEGAGSVAIGVAAHAEGSSCIVNGEASHAEGFGNEIRAKFSHAEGRNNFVYAQTSHVEGYNNTINSDAPLGAHVEGKYCIQVTLEQQSVIGIGTSNGNRKNGFVMWQDGSAELPSVTNAIINARGPKAIASKDYVDTSISGIVFPSNNLSGILINSNDAGQQQITNLASGVLDQDATNLVQVNTLISQMNHPSVGGNNSLNFANGNGGWSDCDLDVITTLAGGTSITDNNFSIHFRNGFSDNNYLECGSIIGPNAARLYVEGGLVANPYIQEAIIVSGYLINSLIIDKDKVYTDKTIRHQDAINDNESATLGQVNTLISGSINLSGILVNSNDAGKQQILNTSGVYSIQTITDIKNTNNKILTTREYVDTKSSFKLSYSSPLALTAGRMLQADSAANTGTGSWDVEMGHPMPNGGYIISGFKAIIQSLATNNITSSITFRIAYILSDASSVGTVNSTSGTEIGTLTVPITVNTTGATRYYYSFGQILSTPISIPDNAMIFVSIINQNAQALKGAIIHISIEK